jgi:tRNA-2-methylthio-N6-dimethylallyladenosine synthase
MNLEQQGVSQYSNSIKVGDLQFPPRKVWLKTYGCQMNDHDSERILGHLKALNFTQTLEQEDADLLLFNTCAIRDLANQKFYSHLGNTKHRKKDNKEIKIGVGGCIAQTEGKDLIKKYRHLDFAFGTDVLDNINDLVYRVYSGESKFSVTTWDRSENYSIETKITHGQPQAYINIIKGCDKFCSYCIVPFTRGREKSRRIAEIVKDVSGLVKYSGVQEITLLGQNVNSFGKENGERLSCLIDELEKIEGLKLIRYTTSHPYDVSDDLIEAHGKSKKLSNHLHLPVQSGSNSVLKRMLREYSVEHYLGLLDKLRASNPDIVISTDIIAGFPNETEEEHQETLRLLEKAQFDFIYSYVFSPRKGTKAARVEDRVSRDIKGERLREIQAYQLQLQEKIREGMLGKTYRVLVDGQGSLHGVKRWKGRSNCFRIVHLDNADIEQDLMWNWVDVKITKTTALCCNGEVVRVHGRTYQD